ncbi:lipoprotein-releasing ABC transporter permease subunit [Marinimicrobium sp. C2-29]|uniref:lipoprotein-releasing ABC transporter permease subunit n=1 Tax=Marinimicrobium sp. C2-29 TaxID=3139825 RepID=UPI003139A4E0
MPRIVPLYIGLRYTRAKRRNQFISFVSAFSLVGMALGVMALIAVLSVMNGFDREMKARILSVVPHGFIDREPELDDWQALAAQVDQHPEVMASAPYIEGFGLVTHARGVEGVQILGVEPEAQARVSVVEERMTLGSTDELVAGEFRIVMGRLLARQLGLALGDKVRVTLPDIRVTPAGIFPRVRRFTLVGVFEVGAQMDQSLAMIHLDDARRLFRVEGVQGLQLQVSDIYRAAPVLSELASQLGPDYRVRDWSQTQGSLFQAVKMEKLVIAVLLGIIIAVAAFNIVSSLVLMVADKRSDIAVLRTLGMSARQIMAVFVVQGSAVGIAGTAIGAVLGCLLALNIGALVASIESLLGLRIFDPAVYFISHLPSELMWQDVASICGVALLLSFLATLYPAWRAAKIEPAEALRYE